MLILGGRDRTLCQVQQNRWSGEPSLRCV